MRIRHRLWLLVLLTLAVSACQEEASESRNPMLSERAVEADVRFLADDLLEGRDTGSRGHEIAARYVAAQFQAMGLLPAGEDGTFFQKLDLLQAVRVREQSRFELVAPGNKKKRLTFQEDFLTGLTFEQPAIELTAPMVFVGQAVQAPELEHDDFAGIDLHGKIAVSFSNAPASFPGDERAYYASTLTKAETLVRLGAVGWIQLSDPADEERRPWARGAANWQQPSMRLVEPDGNVLDTFPELKVRASVSPTASALLFSEAERTWAEVLEANQRGENKALDLNQRVTIASRQVLTRLSSRNVVARLPGIGPLADQHLALTSHLDHIGIGAEIAGDALYNGAQDNAVGIAILLETARQAMARPTLRRSLVFVATTGEEKGLLGAHQFARHPTVGRVIANLNMDMPVLLVPTKDVTPIGLEHTSLASAVKQAAKEMGVDLSPDPAPDENTFVRSDQYAFIRRGIPSVYVDGGYVAVDPKQDAKALQLEFLRTHYHQPSDDLRLPVVWSDAARMARLNARIAELVANDPVNPRWREGDFFGRRFGGGR